MKRYIKSSVSWSYYDNPKFTKLNEEYLPDYGEGDNRASQAVAALNKIVFRWYNDGDVYDTSWYQSEWGNDLSSYANWLYWYIPESKDALYKVFDCRDEDMYETILKNVYDAIMNEDVLSKYRDMLKRGSIYDCDGPFKCEEYFDEDEDYNSAY